MKKLFTLTITFLIFASNSAFSVTIVPNIMAVAALSNETAATQNLGAAVFTSVEASTTSTSFASPILGPVLGVIIFADGTLPLIDLENSEAIDQLLAIQISIEDGEELTEFQRSFLNVGIDAHQLDENANIID